MTPPLAPGQIHELETVVAPELTAAALGNPGVHVFGTPAVIVLMENACHQLMVPHLPPGAGTVGTAVDMRHLAATPVGMRVRARATLVEVEGRRARFRVEVWDEVELVAEGTHERVTVSDLARFLQRAAAKRAR